MIEIRKLLRKHDYVTVIEKVDDGCIVTFPHPKLVDDSPRIVEYFSFKRGEESGVLTSTSWDKTADEKFIPMPEYVMRLYIMTETIAVNSSIPIDSSMTVYVGEDSLEYDDLAQVIQPPSTPEEVKKEEALINLVTEAVNNGFAAKYEEIAKSNDIGEGFDLIRKFYK